MNWYKIQNQSGGAASIDLFGIIGDEVDAASFKADLDRLGDVRQINLNVHSRGGSVFEGLAIHGMLANHQARITATVNGLAASIASVIIMAADVVKIAKNGFIMIHNPAAAAYGSSDELRRFADLSDQIRNQMIGIYRAKTGLKDQEIGDMMDKETWMTGQEATRLGFADVVLEPVAIAACVERGTFLHVPPELLMDNSISEMQAEWLTTPELQNEFLGDFDSFVAFKRNESNTTIIGGKVIS